MENEDIESLAVALEATLNVDDDDFGTIDPEDDQLVPSEWSLPVELASETFELTSPHSPRKPRTPSKPHVGLSAISWRAPSAKGRQTHSFSDSSDDDSDFSSTVPNPLGDDKDPASAPTPPKNNPILLPFSVPSRPSSQSTVESLSLSPRLVVRDAQPPAPPHDNAAPSSRPRGISRAVSAQKLDEPKSLLSSFPSQTGKITRVEIEHLEPVDLKLRYFSSSIFISFTCRARLSHTDLSGQGRIESHGSIHLNPVFIKPKVDKVFQGVFASVYFPIYLTCRYC